MTTATNRKATKKKRTKRVPTLTELCNAPLNRRRRNLTIMFHSPRHPFFDVVFAEIGEE